MATDAQTLVTVEQLLRKWSTPLADVQQQALQRMLESLTGSRDSQELEQAEPGKAVLLEAVKQWLMAVHATWDVKFTAGKQRWDEFAQADALQALSLSELDEALLAHASESVLLMLWSHPRTKTKVRGMGKEVFLRSTLPRDVDVFDVSAVLASMTKDHSSPEMAAALRKRIQQALSTLGHFTSKPVHTSASAVGVALPGNVKGAGPYLTASLLIQQGRPLWLDQAVNDNTGQAIGYLEILNGTSQEDNPAILELVQQVAQDYFAQGRAQGAESIDPRLRQIFLPTADGRYRAVTPLVSMGLSAYLHSRWQDWTFSAEENHRSETKRERLSFGEPVRYGFSSTAINNFTAIRKIGHQRGGTIVGDIPNRALLFNVPSLDEARSTLARIHHRGYALRLPAWLESSLRGAYEQADAAVLAENSLRALEIERAIHKPVMRWLVNDLHHLRDQCSDVLDDMAVDEQAKWLDSSVQQPVVVRYLLAGLNRETPNSVDAGELGNALARQLYLQLDGLGLGLSRIDRQRFMRWAPETIVQAMVAH